MLGVMLFILACCLPRISLSSPTSSRGNPLIGRKELAECGYGSVCRDKEMVVTASSLDMQMWILPRWNIPLRYMSLIIFSVIVIWKSRSRKPCCEFLMVSGYGLSEALSDKSV